MSFSVVLLFKMFLKQKQYIFGFGRATQALRLSSHWFPTLCAFAEWTIDACLISDQSNPFKWENYLIYLLFFVSNHLMRQLYMNSSLFQICLYFLHLVKIGQTLFLQWRTVKHTSIVPSVKAVKGQCVGNQRGLTHRTLWGNRSRSCLEGTEMKREAGSRQKVKECGFELHLCCSCPRWNEIAI